MTLALRGGETLSRLMSRLSRHTRPAAAGPPSRNWRSDSGIGHPLRALAAVHRQRSLARELLGPEHPLLRVVDDMRTRRTQAGVVLGLFAASAAAALAGVSAARPVLAAAALVQVALACSLALLSAGRRDRALDLIIEGGPDLALAPVARERARLVDPRRRAELSHSLDGLRREAAQRRLRGVSDRPLYVGRVIAAVAADIAETAHRLRSADAALAGVAMAERLLTRHDSPLYGESAEVLRVELRRCRFLLAASRPSPVESGARISTASSPDGTVHATLADR